MKKLYLLVLLFQFFVRASAQTLDWAHSLACETACPTISSSTGYGITHDIAGNSYTTGTFYMSLDADPGPGTYTLSSSAAAAYIIKLNSTGGFVWAIAFETNDLCSPREIVLDASGNVYTTGLFRGDCDFDPGPSTHILTAPTYPKSSSFISKLDTNGNFVWVNVIGNGTDRADGYNIKIDRKGEIVTSGIFSGKVDFDPGTGSATYEATVTDNYLCKYDRDGNLIWADQLKGNYVSYCSGLDIDKDNQIYLGGAFDGTVDFDPGPLVSFITSTDEYDLFITKFTSAGELIWAKTIGDIYVDNFSTLVVDKQSNIYCTGTFFGKLDFDPGPGTHFQTATSTDGSDFLLKLDKDGVFKRAQVYDFSNQYSSLVTTDTAGNIYTTGSFKKSFDFDFGTGTHMLTPKGSISDIYTCKYNSDGELKWATQISGKKNPGKMHKISVDPTGGIFTTGVLNDSADFAPGPDTLILRRRNLLGDAFVVKMHNCVIDINRTITKTGVMLTSNESTGLTYQWIDCATKTAIPGATSVSYMPVKSGFYAVAISKQYCSDTAYCFDYIPTEIEEFDFSDRMTLTPNPSKGAVTIQLGKKFAQTNVKVNNVIGQTIYSNQFFGSDQLVFDFTCPAGIYFVTVKTTEGTTKTFKIIRE